MTLVPERPLALKRSFVLLSVAGGILLVLLGVGAAVGYLGWQWVEAQDLLQTQQRWDRSVETEATVGGDVESRLFVFDSYDLEISYLDPEQDTRRTADYEFYTFLGGPDVDADVSVRFDPQNPEVPVVSWAVEAQGARWRAVAFMVIAGLLIALSFVVLGYRALSRWRSASLAAMASLEAHCPIVDIERRSVKGQQFMDVKYQLPPLPEVPVHGRSKQFKVSYQLAKRQPLFADAASSQLVALIPRARPTVPVPMSDDLHPYVLSPEQRAAFDVNRRQLEGGPRET